LHTHHTHHTQKTMRGDMIITGIMSGDCVDVADAAEAIRGAAVRVAGLHLVRVAESHGRYAAVFEVQPIPTYSKGLATR